jgi:hypothetical protein
MKEVACTGVIRERARHLARIGYASCAPSVVVGFVVMLGLGVPKFEEGRMAIGLIVIACSGSASGLGVAGLVSLARKSERPG